MVPPERGLDNDYRSGGAVFGVAATDCQQRTVPRSVTIPSPAEAPIPLAVDPGILVQLVSDAAREILVGHLDLLGALTTGCGEPSPPR
jgi:hypothetical protein